MVSGERWELLESSAPTSSADNTGLDPAPHQPSRTKQLTKDENSKLLLNKKPIGYEAQLAAQLYKHFP